MVTKDIPSGVVAVGNPCKAVSYTHLDVYKRQHQIAGAFFQGGAVPCRRIDKAIPGADAVHTLIPCLLYTSVAYMLYVTTLIATIRRIVEFAEQFQRGMTGIERFAEIKMCIRDSTLTAGIVLKLAALYFVLRIIDGAASYYMSSIGHIMGCLLYTSRCV